MTINSKNFPKDSEGIKRIGYVRLSRDDAKSMSVENQMKALAEYDPAMQIVVDKGVSGETNITDPKTAWNRELMPALQAHPDTQLVVYTLDRVGRKKGKVMSAIEDLIDNGGTLYVLRDKKLYDNPENFEQAVQLALGSLVDENYRVEGTLKTQRAIDVLKQAGVKLGAPPRLHDKDVKQIRDLHERGLGFASIGKIVRTRRARDGEWQNTSPRVIKRVLDGTYETREEFNRKNGIARLSMLLSEIGPRDAS
ncbi:hypothetical protein DBR36_03450 [Microbacterium sp. HMWF026]|uniref:recombinase family protein n=1 Tax=Microbacterium sp. HMWF026 TaxID=2056861 RepID=UPI000D39F9D1|nr:recombinase family protein [Microbacterium sp. HMWF026]PTT21714.1 hypothetical protein DBR36_03450 [Microbacterium sp. HMWF026]